MTTPLQKAALAVIDKWTHSHPLKECTVLELRKALDAEIAESVEPDFYTACAEHNGGWIPLPGYSNETEHGVKSRILEDARKEGWKGTIEGRLFALGWQVMPVYLHPPQPQATTAVPEGYVLVDLSDLKKLSHSICGECYMGCDWEIKCIKSMIAAAQGEKP